MRAVRRPKRRPPGRYIPALIAVTLVAACLPVMPSVPAVRAQFDSAVGPLEDEGSAFSPLPLIAGLSRLPLVAWVDARLGNVVGWISGTAEQAWPRVVPEGVMLRAIPGHSSYLYAVMGGQRLVVDAATHTVVYVVD